MIGDAKMLYMLKPPADDLLIISQSALALCGSASNVQLGKHHTFLDPSVRNSTKSKQKRRFSICGIKGHELHRNLFTRHYDATPYTFI